MLKLVIHQLPQSFAFAAVQFGPLRAGQGAEAGEVLDAGAHFKKLESKSLMLDAASDSGPRGDHGAPVENLTGGRVRQGRIKSKYYFSLCVRLEGRSKFQVKQAPAQ
jgi:hypothetical protein